MSFDPYSKLVGGFSPNDGTIDFYLRINSLLDSSHTVLDLGAGRAAWYEDDKCEVRRNIRLIKGKVSRVIAADVDEVVLENKASNDQLIIKNGHLDIENGSVDLVVADYVLEHIIEPEEFVSQIGNVLRSGGWFCARTPHKFSYVAIAAELIHNSKHSAMLTRIQPGRKEMDVFPTAYRMNTMKDLKTYFAGWNNKSFVFRSDPSYYFGNKLMYNIQAGMHRIIFKELCGNLFIFFQKP
jgi:SAM-dependent methyltransferase